MFFDNRGQVRVIEAFLAVLLITSALALTSRLSSSQKVENNDSLVALGWQTLIELDNEGILGKHIDEGNWTALRDAFQTLFPLGVSFNLTVYDENMKEINDVPISNGLKNDEVVAIQYLCATQGSNYRCYILRLQLAQTK